MKRILLLLLCLGGLQAAWAQAPTITGDTMMCPYTDGTATITNGITYDSYRGFLNFGLQRMSMLRLKEQRRRPLLMTGLLMTNRYLKWWLP